MRTICPLLFALWGGLGCDTTRPVVESPAGERRSPAPAWESGPPRARRSPAPSLADFGDEVLNPQDPMVSSPQSWDEAQRRGTRIRRQDSEHLTLYTDLPPDKAIDELPRDFDRAVSQWCDYFGVKRERVALWRVNGFLMQDRQPFIRLGMFAEDLPPFKHGYSIGGNMWLYEQPTAYYRRHLLLHEGTHAFINDVLHGDGPPWILEGLAELLATHEYPDGQLQLRHFPRSPEEVPRLGRIRLIELARARNRANPLAAVLNYSGQAHLQNEPYAWCWAAAIFLDTHPRYRDTFRDLVRHLDQPGFQSRFEQSYADDWPELLEEWQLFVDTLDHGHDIERTVIDFSRGQPVPLPASISIAADRGWQNSGWRLEAGRRYQFRSQGRYQIADQPRIWWCEPGGVTIRYHAGRPLGMLVGTVRPEDPEARSKVSFLHPISIGLTTEYRPHVSGTLYLQINESPGQLFDNKGQLRVDVAAGGEGAAQ